MDPRARALFNRGLSDPRLMATMTGARVLRHAIADCVGGWARRFDYDACERVAALAARL